MYERFSMWGISALPPETVAEGSCHATRSGRPADTGLGGRLRVPTRVEPDVDLGSPVAHVATDPHAPGSAALVARVVERLDRHLQVGAHLLEGHQAVGGPRGPVGGFGT